MSDDDTMRAQGVSRQALPEEFGSYEGDEQQHARMHHDELDRMARAGIFPSLDDVCRCRAVEQTA